jgi:hypothetical protein
MRTQRFALGNQRSTDSRKHRPEGRTDAENCKWRGGDGEGDQRTEAKRSGEGLLQRILQRGQNGEGRERNEQAAWSGSRASRRR